MKCLLVSDLHYTLKQFDWVLNEAADFDLVVIAGDHLDISSTVEVRAQITVIQAYLRRIGAKTQLVVCSGNHDLDALNAAGEKYARWIQKARQYGVPTDTDSMMVGDTLFTICPWWEGPASCSQVGELLERDSQKPRQQWIWVYHAPPDASPTSWGGQKYFGDTQLVAWIQQYQPQMVFSGHIHQSPFKAGGSWTDRIGDTWIFNSGRQPGPFPAHVVINTAEQMALWFSLAGAETVCLNQPLVRPVAALTEMPAWLKK